MQGRIKTGNLERFIPVFIAAQLVQEVVHPQCYSRYESLETDPLVHLAYAGQLMCTRAGLTLSK